MEENLGKNFVLLYCCIVLSLLVTKLFHHDRIITEWLRLQGTSGVHLV